MATLNPSEYSTPPPGYQTPSWPGLHLPWNDGTDLYYPSSIWAFTVYWLLVMNLVVFGLSGIYAAAVFGRRGGKQLPFAIGVPLAIVVLQGVIAFASATVIGFAIAAIYVAAYLRMSTWIPFLWAFAHTLVVVVSSYTTVTTLL